MVAVHGEPFIICQLNISCYSPHIYLPLSSSSLLRDNTAKQWRVNTVREHTTCLQTVFVLFFVTRAGLYLMFSKWFQDNAKEQMKKKLAFSLDRKQNSDKRFNVSADFIFFIAATGFPSMTHYTEFFCATRSRIFF